MSTNIPAAPGGKRWRRRLSWLLVATIFAIAGFAAYSAWKAGVPYQTAYWSPNKRYYVQKYSNVTLFLALPGQGSDGVNGYIRVYSSDGKLIHERFEHFIRDIDPVWDGNKVYLKGVAELDNHPWVLPGSAE